MNKQTTLADLLEAEMQMDQALILMNDDISLGNFTDAMESQLEYLFRRDLWTELLSKHFDEYFELIKMARGTT